jgi:hypothetical protein
MNSRCFPALTSHPPTFRRRARTDKVWLAIGILRSLQTEEALRERVEYYQRQAHRLKFRRGRHAGRHRLEPALGQTVANAGFSGRATMQVTAMFACGRRREDDHFSAVQRVPR